MFELTSLVPERYSHLIERIWIAHTSAEEFDLYIPPTPYINALIPFNEKVSYNSILIDSPVIHGLLTKPIELKVPKETVIVGIRFFNYGWYPFSNQLLTHPTNTTVPLPATRNFIKDLRDLYENSKINEIGNYIEDYLSQIYSAEKELKTKVIAEYSKEIRENNNLSISDFCEKADINYVTFYRLFLKTVGLTPKKYERLIKFRKSLDKILHTSDGLTNIGLTSGYFDQAHFVKEFKHFMRKTPSEYIKRYNQLKHTRDIESILKFSTY